MCGTLSDGAHHGGGLNGQDAYSGRILPVVLDTTCPSRGGGQAVIAIQDARGMDKKQNGKGWSEDGLAYTVDAVASQGVFCPAFARRSQGFDILGTPATEVAKETEVHTVLRARTPGQFENSTVTVVVCEPLPFDTTQVTSSTNRSNPQPGDPCHPIAAGGHPPAICYTGDGGAAPAGQVVPSGGGDVAWPATIAPTLYALMGDKMGMENQHINSGAGHFVPTLSPCLETQVGGLRQPDTQAYVVNAMPASLGKGLGHNKDDYCVPSTRGVRRLTPTECERLQGFPDGFTRIPYRGKAAEDCPDGPRYKALGNSMAVPVMRWIGERIALAEALDQVPPVPSVPSVPAWLQTWSGRQEQD